MFSQRKDDEDLFPFTLGCFMQLVVRHLRMKSKVAMWFFIVLIPVDEGTIEVGLIHSRRLDQLIRNVTPVLNRCGGTLSPTGITGSTPVPVGKTSTFGVFLRLSWLVQTLGDYDREFSEEAPELGRKGACETEASLQPESQDRPWYLSGK